MWIASTGFGRSLNIAYNMAPTQPGPAKAIESYRRGYPQTASFMTADKAFTISKRFDVLHMRNILYHQDIIFELEDHLNGIDNAEKSQSYLSSRRYDGNEERKNLMEELDHRLGIYGISMDYIFLLPVDADAPENPRRSCPKISYTAGSTRSNSTESPKRM